MLSLIGGPALMGPTRVLKGMGPKRALKGMGPKKALKGMVPKRVLKGCLRVGDLIFFFLLVCGT